MRACDFDFGRVRDRAVWRQCYLVLSRIGLWEDYAMKMQGAARLRFAWH